MVVTSSRHRFEIEIERDFPPTTRKQDRRALGKIASRARRTMHHAMKTMTGADPSSSSLSSHSRRPSCVVDPTNIVACSSCLRAVYLLSQMFWKELRLNRDSSPSSASAQSSVASPEHNELSLSSPNPLDSPFQVDHFFLAIDKKALFASIVPEMEFVCVKEANLASNDRSNAAQMVGNETQRSGAVVSPFPTESVILASSSFSTSVAAPTTPVAASRNVNHPDSSASLRLSAVKWSQYLVLQPEQQQQQHVLAETPTASIHSWQTICPLDLAGGDPLFSPITVGEINRYPYELQTFSPKRLLDNELDVVEETIQELFGQVGQIIDFECDQCLAMQCDDAI